MNPSLLYHKLFEILLIYVLPTILLFVIVHLLFSKKFRLVAIIGVMILAFLPSEVTFIICLFLLVFSILAGFLAFCFFANEIINFDRDLDEFPPSSIPIIIVTPPTESHFTNLPPRYFQQNAVFLMVIPRSILKKRNKSRFRSPKGRRGSK
ncbi:uncharacterized protein MELLADRAFT_124050 [Melampsora larici-populina 98AG31]|uniref:Secreted protein n=1 Tax=Melampsora larici-populina (strain 98AG31 / pathotype 3-4-7) TaxID=747676 RepID=F4RCN8_MELLP|nr:uncharacterized protein MELLADRAFT_124050 [Melampsora larici-populina 98AG31]EGG09664.1 secreted protein [Melampsora larici-populina 98AG31]